MSRKALFFDVDGTLLSEKDRTIPDSAARALEEARSLGHLIFVNTGRVISHMGPVQKLLEVDGYLCGCGTNIYADGKELYHYHIEHERGIQIKKEIVAYGFEGILEAKQGLYLPQTESKIPEVERFRDTLRANGAVRPEHWDDDSYDYDKFCVTADENSDREGFFKAMSPDIEVIDRGSDFFECVPANHSKATAIEFILKHYGMELEDAYVFGDSMNDLPMFQYAKNAILMGHHDAELEPYASFITREVEDDGVEYAMRQLAII